MKKSAEKAGEHNPGPCATEPVAPIDRKALQSEISNQICTAAARMVGTTIQQVNDGHYQAMKYLFEMIGLFPAPTMPEAPQEDSLAGMLLNRLEMREETLPEEPRNPREETKAEPATT